MGHTIIIYRYNGSLLAGVMYVLSGSTVAARLGLSFENMIHFSVWILLSPHGLTSWHDGYINILNVMIMHIGNRSSKKTEYCATGVQESDAAV